MSFQAQGTIKEEEEIKETQDVNNVGMKIKRAKEVYKAYEEIEEKPTKIEVWLWCLYGLCSYFIHTVLIPIVFPIIVTQTVHMPQGPKQGWMRKFEDLDCNYKGMQLYQGLIHQSIKINSIDFSPLQWTSISWAIGLALVTPILGLVSIHLDYGQAQQLTAGVATAVGSLLCLPAGFFKTRWIFPLYIAAIVAANTISTAFHARHFGLMVRGFMGRPTIKRSQFPNRKAVAGWLSLSGTAAGCFGSAIISAFTYHMLRATDNFTSLWVVSIFSGLIWFIGMVHIVTANRPGANSISPKQSIPKNHIISIFKYPHAAGSLAGVFISSFTAMCIFSGGVLYAIGDLCFEPVNILILWLVYFISPMLSLPLAHPFGQLIRADAVKMKLLGFLFTVITSGFGFYYRHENWHKQHVMVFAAIQSTGAGLLHAFSRVLLLDCAPAGNEGAFSVWFSWVRAAGTCAGFAFASASPGNISRAFGVAFVATFCGMIILIFGNISNFRGAKAAGHVREQHSEKGSPDQRGEVFVEAPPERKMEI